MLGNMGTMEWILIAFLVLLLFGAKRLPNLAKNLGHGIREFKKSMSGAYDDEHHTIEDREDKKTSTKKKK